MNEIVRRVDIKGRTIGEILREDIKIDGLHCGLLDSEVQQVSLLEAKSMSWLVYNSIIPYSMGSKVDLNIFELYQRKRKFEENMKKLGPQQPVIKGSREEPYLRHTINENEVIRKGEIPSSNCHGNARGLAKLAAIMSNQGKLIHDNNLTLLSQPTWQQMHDNATWALDAYLGNKMYGIIHVCIT